MLTPAAPTLQALLAAPAFILLLYGMSTWRARGWQLAISGGGLSPVQAILAFALLSLLLYTVVLAAASGDFAGFSVVMLVLSELPISALLYRSTGVLARAVNVVGGTVTPRNSAVAVDSGAKGGPPCGARLVRAACSDAAMPVFSAALLLLYVGACKACGVSAELRIARKDGAVAARILHFILSGFEKQSLLCAVDRFPGPSCMR